MITLLSHFYNEEYLLPFWIEHHKKMFSHAILIDYSSTDNSLEIIKKLAPSEWKVVQSENKMFDAELVDNEIMKIESTIQGYKICLNTTEFLFSSENIESILNEKIYYIQKYVICDNGNYSNPQNLNDFINGCKYGYLSENDGRFIHDTKNYRYTIGRHGFITNDRIYCTDKMAIAHCKYYPWNKETIKRKLQISNRIPEEDKMRGRGIDHLMTDLEMNERRIAGLKKTTRILGNII